MPSFVLQWVGPLLTLAQTPAGERTRAERIDAGLLWLVALMPLGASLLTAAFGRRLGGKAHWPCWIALFFSFFFAFSVMGEVEKRPAGGAIYTADRYEWVDTTQAGGQVNVRVSLRADTLTAVMLVTVTFVSFLVSIFSAGYMHDDPGYPRFFAIFALFVFCMTMLVMASNFILLYVFWEGVGLCSYLLIGFWYQKPSAAQAARKAFLVNRIGDFGFALGVFLLWTTFGGYLDYDNVFRQAAGADETTLTAICLLLFVGAMGKSAQFPLHVWLPDAMEGPTPVSALIHAATMVTAGVYMVARCTPLFVKAELAQLFVAGIGGFTALLAALIALTQTDLKRVMAYSTVSQLGFMFLALGSCAGNKALAPLAVTAAIFHLFTHAFFKALLFLASGSVMHGMGNVIDMRRFSGLRHVMPVTHWTFLAGALSLAGFPLITSGFWSKDEILASVYHGMETHYWYFLLLAIVAVFTAFLTAFYTFRAYFLTFWGPEKFPPEAGHHPHESPRVMAVPLMILAGFALLAGPIFGPTHWFAEYLERMSGLPHAEGHYGMESTMMLWSMVVAVAGIGVAYVFYVQQPGLPEKVRNGVRQFYDLSLNKFYLDELFAALVVTPAKGLAAFCREFDRYVVDGLVDLVGWLPGELGRLFRPVQNGLVQFYALAMLMGLVVFVVALVARLGG